MINQPDLFREMDYLSRTVKAIYKDPSMLAPREILKMVTSNAAEVLMRKEIGSIEEGKRADIVMISNEDSNMIPFLNPISSIIHRARSENVKLVMINGEIVFSR